jgi:hypothetical protein
MGTTHTVRWDKLDQKISGLRTDLNHDIRVQREAIPLVFVPGIMGTRLRVAGTDGTGDGANGLPNMRWNPSSTFFMLKHFSGTDGAHRKRMLVGDGNFFPGFLEVDNANPVGDGFHGIFDEYWKFLKPLRKHDWGPLRKIFEFPVYAVGYNWTGSNDDSGKMLASRINQIIDEAKSITGLCEKVILITHSMGGLVSRSASNLHGAEGHVLGIVHGVQPVTGSPAAYWRMKAGFEGLGPSSRVLGNSGPTVTPVLGNLPGGLQLLPNKNYVTNNNHKAWLSITKDGKTTLSLPNSDPYQEIYRVKARVQPTPGEKPSTNKYWGLVDPDLLDPGKPAPSPTPAPLDPKKPTSLSAAAPPHGDPWQQYLDMLKIAESFHDRLGMYQHAHTFCFRGVNHKSADVVELRIESNWVRSEPYPKRGFRGFFTDAAGNSMQAVLQDPAGDGDGTVPRSSASALDKPGKEPPGDLAIDVEHQPAYKDEHAQEYAIQAVIALAKVRYEALRGKIKS